MKFKHTLAFLMLLFLSIIGCKQDNEFISEIQEVEIENTSEIEAYYTFQQTVGANTRTRTAQDELADIFQYLVNKKVITNDFVQNTGYPVWHLFRSNKGQGDNLHILPTAIPESGTVSGIWYYYNDGNSERIYFDNKDNLINSFNGMEEGTKPPMNINARAANFADLQSLLDGKGYSEFNDIYHATVRGGEDNDETEEPCIGGEFVDILVWVYDPSANNVSSSAIQTVYDALNSLENQLDMTSQVGINIEAFITMLDGSANSALEAMVNNWLLTHPQYNTNQIKTFFDDYKDLSYPYRWALSSF